MSIDIWNGRVVETQERPGELFNMNRTGQVAKAAADANMNLSQFFEKADPSKNWANEPGEEGIDAFGRQLRAANLVTVSDPVVGRQASLVQDFADQGAHFLLHEFCSRRWREARWGRPVNPSSGGIVRTMPDGRSVFTSADEGLGTIWRPIFELSGERTNQISAPIQLSSIVAMEQGIPTNTYKTAYVDDPTAEELRMFRVGEAAEIPITKFVGGEYEVSIYKYGRGFQLTYEQIRRAPIDKLSFWVQRAAIQEEMDKVEHAVDTLINGDGNNNAAVSYDLTDLDASATPGTLTVKAWLAFKGKFANNYAMDVVFAREVDWMDMQMLALPNANPLFYQVAPQYGGIRNINMNIDQSVGLGKLDTVPVDTLVGIDTRFALEHVYEIGAQIREAMRFANNQTTAIFLSEVEGFSVLDENATRILNLAA